MIFWNCDGFVNLSDFGSDAQVDFEVLCVSETWIQGDPVVVPAFLKDYNYVLSPAVKEKSHGRASGGIIVFYKNYYSRETLYISPWWLVVKLSVNNFQVIITSVYFKPSLDINYLLELFLPIIDEVDLRFRYTPHIIGGDFNCRVGSLGAVSEEFLQDTNLYHFRSSCDTILKPRGGSLIDFMTHNSFTLLNGRTVSDTPAQYTFVGERGCSTIDLVFCNNVRLSEIYDLNVMSIVNRSPHFPILLEFSRPSPCQTKGENNLRSSARMRQLLKWRDQCAPNYSEEMYYSSNVAYNFDNADNALENLYDTIYEVSMKIGATRKAVASEHSERFGKPWFDSVCRALKREVKSALSVCKHNNFSEPYKQNYIDAKKKFKKTVIFKKQAYERLTLSKLSNTKNLTEFWKTIRIYRSKGANYSHLGIEEWERFYDGLFAVGETVSVDFLDARHPILDTAISENEMLGCLAKCNNNKAPGKDGIAYEFIKNLPHNWILYICTLFNRILDTEVVPSSWGEMLLTLIHKKGPLNDPSNYRGIALVSCLAKLFTHILLDRLTQWSEANNVLPECQSGFRPGRGCVDNIFTLTSAIQINLRLRKRKVFAAFIDLKRAFDTVDHLLLWNKLYKAGVSSKIIRIIKSLYQAATVQIKVGSEYSKKYNVTQGVLQGECLSPMLFALFLADIEHYFRLRGFDGLNIDSYNDILMLLYADDLVLLADSQSDLNRKLSCLSDYCRQNRLTVNVQKTKIMCFSRGGFRSSLDANSFYFEGSKVEVVNRFAYLGVTFTSSALFLEMARAATNKAKMATGASIGLMVRSKLDCWESRLTLYQSIVINSLTHCAAVWGLRYPDIIETAQTGFLKRLLSLTRSTPNYILRLETGLSHLCLTVFKMALNWQQKLLIMSESRYPKICYNRLLYLDARDLSVDAYNWVSQLRSLYFNLGYERLWLSLSLRDLKASKNDLIESYRQNLMNDDLARLQDSRYSNFFTFYRFSESPKSYLQLKCPMQIIRVIAQLRLSGARYLSFYINGSRYSIDPTKLCTICNLGEEESVFHIFFRCPIYSPIRSSFLTNVEDLGALAQILENLDLAGAKRLFYFLKGILMLRSFILNE